VTKDNSNLSFGRHFQHPIFQSWDKIRFQQIEHIYVREGQVYTEHTVRGDQVGYATQGITTLAQDFKPSVWVLELACWYPYWSIVFAPKEFDIKKFHHDLSLLFFLGTLGKLVNRSNYLEDWEVLAGHLSPGVTWGETQGWWHTDQNIIVVSLVREGAHELWKHLSQTFSIPTKQTVEIRDYSIYDAGLLKAMELIQLDMQLHPRS
jgi:hypothetical protein